MGETHAFKIIFQEYYKPLCQFTLRYVPAGEVVEELVSDVLIRLWQERETLQIQFSLRAYLFTAVKNACLNYLKSKIVRYPLVSNSALEALLVVKIKLIW